MTYANRTLLEESYGADVLTQRESMLATGCVARALSDADAEIDSYVSGRYAVPLSPVPDNLPRLAGAMAFYYLLGSSAEEIPRKGYEDARAWLKEVAAGRIVLTSATVAVNTATGGRPVTRTPAKQFNGASLADY